MESRESLLVLASRKKLIALFMVLLNLKFSLAQDERCETGPKEQGGYAFIFGCVLLFGLLLISLPAIVRRKKREERVNANESHGSESASEMSINHGNVSQCRGAQFSGESHTYLHDVDVLRDVVTVCIWDKGNAAVGAATRGEVGHVSIFLGPDFYVSCLPGPEDGCSNNKKSKRSKKGRPIAMTEELTRIRPAVFADFDYDMEDNGGTPNVYFINNLDVESMKKAYLEIDSYEYVLMRGLKDFSLGKLNKCTNCCLMTLQLLCMGGLYDKYEKEMKKLESPEMKALRFMNEYPKLTKCLVVYNPLAWAVAYAVGPAIIYYGTKAVAQLLYLEPSDLGKIAREIHRPTEAYTRAFNRLRKRERNPTIDTPLRNRYHSLWGSKHFD